MAEIVLNNLEAGLKRLAEVLEFFILDEMSKRFQSEVGDKIIDNLMSTYKSELSKFSPKYDPANPTDSGEVEEFRKFLKEDIESTFRKDIANKKISVKAGDVITLGYDMSPKERESRLRRRNVKDPDMFYWLIFYLEGVSGNYYFITREDMKKLVEAGVKPPQSLASFSQWGWYGDGFLIGGGKKGEDEVKNLGGIALKKHPFSGKPPTELFETAMNGIDFEQFVNNCISSAIKRAT